METLQLLGAGLGLATLAGINLYLTVFVTGLAIQQHWITLSAQYQGLAILGEPAIVIVAGVLYFIEFLADKVPGLDSAWDAVHTAIRPIGGAFLALRAVGTPDPVFDVIVALLGGGVALTAHSAKAGTRLLVNASPEPFSNILISTAEDVGVLGGLWMIKNYPGTSFVVFTCLIASILYWLPRLFRAARVKFWLLWQKISASAGTPDATLHAELPAEAAIQLAALNVAGARPLWAAACITSSSKDLPMHARGHLVALDGDQNGLYFIGRSGWKKVAQRLELKGWQVARQSRFLSEELVLFGQGKKEKHIFLFERPRAGVVKTLQLAIKDRLALPAPSAVPALSASEP